MAKRSELAQKLLDDLRLRKERMAMSHASSYSNQMPSGGNFRKPMQRSRPVDTREKISSSLGDQNKRFITSHNRPLIKERASEEIVPLGRARNSQYIGDLSMAIAFALENGGTLGQLTSSGNPMLGLLHHIGRSVDFVQMDRSSSLVRNRPSNSSFPMLSHLHMKEISEGAQKLNQILNACSNGLNFDRYSVDIGKELLKGAMELEESLRMLVNLQEASEYMVSPQRKQRIRLLEDGDGNETTVIKGNHHKQVNHPKFSFKGPTRSSPEDSREVTKASLLKQQLLALPYPTEASQFSSSNQTPTTSSRSVCHRRSVGCGPNSSTLTPSSESKQHSYTSHSKTEKGRIPNVIAKLMGLQELPPNTTPKNGAEKQRVLKPEKVSKDGKQITEGRAKKEERTRMDYRSPSSGRTQTPRQQGLHAKISATPGSCIGPAAEKILVLYNGRIEFVSHEETPHFKGPKDLENMILLSNSKPAIKLKGRQVNTNQLSKISGIQQNRQRKEREEKSNPRDWKTIQKSVNSEAQSYDVQRMVPQANKHQEAADSMQDKGMEKQHHKEKKNAENFYMSTNQLKAPHKIGSQQPRESKSQGAKLNEDEKRKPNTKGKLQVNNPKSIGTLLKNSLKPMHGTANLLKKLPRMNYTTAGERSHKKAFETMPSEGSQKNSHGEDLINDGITTNHKLNNDSSDESSKAQADNDAERIRSALQWMLSEAMHVQSRQENLSSRDMDTRVNSQKGHAKVDEAVTQSQKNGSTNNTGQPLKQQILVLQQLEQRKAEETQKSKEEELSINMSTEAKASESMNLEKAESSSTFNIHAEDSCQIPREMDAIALHAITNDKTSGVSNSPRDLVPILGKDEAVPFYAISGPLKDSSEKGILGIFNSSQQDHQKTCGGHSLLKESENHLKQIVLRSQIFLNKAEMLFGLLIPIDVLHSSAHTYKDDESRLVLDCCDEVMKRKSRRKELTFYPCARIFTRSVKLKALDDLVKELHEDLEALKFPNRDSGDENGIALYLHSMLDRDIQNWNPDLNCMWDFGWSETMSTYIGKDEVVRDVEKFVLKGLINEILEDILQVSISVQYRNSNKAVN